MSKSVMISIKPRWCELIAFGKKTVEVRKTFPKLKTPFKCYIYCTRGVPFLNRHNGKLYLEAKDRLGGHGKGLYERLSGKVIGEFVCDKIAHMDIDSVGVTDENGYYLSEIGWASCLSRKEIIEYCGIKRPYGWHISDLKIYDKPKELSEFQRACTHNEDCGSCKRWDTKKYDCIAGITRPPQSWCYVEEARQ